MQTPIRFQAIRLLPFLVLPLLALLALAIPAQAAAVAPEEAGRDLEQLAAYVKKKKSLNDDLVEYLKAVSAAYNNFEMPAQPAEDASEDEKKAWVTEKKKADKAQSDFNKKAKKLIFKCLTLQRIDRSGSTNLRDDVNIRSAEIVGELAKVMDESDRKDTSKRLIKSIESLKKAKYQVNADHLDAMFAALGLLNEASSLEWMLEEYSNTNNADDAIVSLIAAHKAMVLFTDMPGSLAYEISDEFTKTYSSVESQAEQSSTDKNVQAAKRMWDRIRVYTIRVVQYYAKEPTDEEGQALNTMETLYYWFKDHKNKRKAPWVEEKKPKK